MWLSRSKGGRQKGREALLLSVYCFQFRLYMKFNFSIAWHHRDIHIGIQYSILTSQLKWAVLKYYYITYWQLQYVLWDHTNDVQQCTKPNAKVPLCNPSVSLLPVNLIVWLLVCVSLTFTNQLCFSISTDLRWSHVRFHTVKLFRISVQFTKLYIWLKKKSGLWIQFSCLHFRILTAL